MRILCCGAVLLAALAVTFILSAPEAEASPLAGVDAGVGLADVYIGFGYRHRRPCRRYYVRRTYIRRPAVRYYRYSYSSPYPGYHRGYWARPHYYGHGYPRASIGFHFGGHRHYGHHHHRGSRRVVGRRR